MDWCLTAVAWSDPVWIWNVLKVLIGLGMVIFVHELGHFLVAKLCGVKCEKFYLGFDIGGIKLWKFRWGETEYGIGVLPLGGYVKMLGQEDNPSRIREEMERARKEEGPQAGDERRKATNDASTARGAGSADGRATDGGTATDATSVAFDPRSYLAQSVPKRMAIISAGVVMNVLFALFTAVWAYWIGLDEVECGVGAVVPGAPAWQANLKVGDEITEIRGKPVDRYKDLRAAVSVGDIEGGVPLVIRRRGEPEPISVTVQPRQTKGIPYPTIGVHMPMTPVLNPLLPAIPGTPAAAAEPALAGGDRIVAINDQSIEDYAQVHRMLALNVERAISVTVERGSNAKSRGKASEGPLERITTAIAPSPVRDLGLAMTMGEITAIQSQSPAEAAGILPGDRITHIDGRPVDDPLRLPDQLRARAWQDPNGATVTVTIVRPNQPKPLEIPVKLRRPDWYETPHNAVSIPAMGVAYTVENSVAAVHADGPAARAGLKPGDVVVKAALIPPASDSVRQMPLGEAYVNEGLNDVITVDLKEDPRAWPAFFEVLQLLLPGGKVELTLADRTVVPLEPVAVAGWFQPKRGFSFEVKTFFSGGKSLGLALRLGSRETIDAMTMVYRFLSKLGTQVSPKAFGGPISIFAMAYGSASQGFSDLLIFLTVIGANLAVINFLPIPVLDGGHMVFLAYEGITGKPPSERVQVVLTYLGLLFILALMLWVLWLDIVRYASSLFTRMF